MDSNDKKFHFTDAQRSTLGEYYNVKGITSVSKKNATVIAQIAVVIAAKEEQVKVCVRSFKFV